VSDPVAAAPGPRVERPDPERLLDARLAALQASLARLDGVLVAFSGGADSALLLAAAVRALDAQRVVAATAVSPSLATDELPAARAFAASLGVRHLTPRTDELARPGYAANGADRCFHCKATLLDTLRPLAAELGLSAVATGTNADDAVAGFRPGIRAAAERGALTPLLDAGLTKEQVRQASGRWGLRTADKPALACLASRLTYGLQVTPSALARVDRAERAVRARLGTVRDVRVRDLGEGAARVELDAEALARCDDEVLAGVRAEGFAVVTARAFRSGSMNDGLVPAGAAPGGEQQPEQRQPEADRHERGEQGDPQRRIGAAEQEGHEDAQDADGAESEQHRARTHQPVTGPAAVDGGMAGGAAGGHGSERRRETGPASAATTTATPGTTRVGT
jgi:uncharacterized protein (TIGR00268 family)